MISSGVPPLKSKFPRVSCRAHERPKRQKTQRAFERRPTFAQAHELRAAAAPPPPPPPDTKDCSVTGRRRRRWARGQARARAARLGARRRGGGRLRARAGGAPRGARALFTLAMLPRPPASRPRPLDAPVLLCGSRTGGVHATRCENCLAEGRGVGRGWLKMGSGRTPSSVDAAAATVCPFEGASAPLRRSPSGLSAGTELLSWAVCSVPTVEG